MQPYPRAPDLVWPGHLLGAGCLSARAVGTGFPTVGLRWWLGPGCGWSWVLFSPARRGWGLGWVCLGSVCGVVPLLPAVCGVRGWALVSARFRDVCGFVRVSLAPRRFRFRCAVWACVLGPGLGCAPPFLAGLSGCVFCAFFFFRFLGVPVPGLVVSPPVSFLFGWAAGFFFFCGCLLVSVPLFPVGRCSWLGVASFCWVAPLCLFRGPVFGALWVGGLASFCVFGGQFGGCGLFSRGPPFPAPFFWGGGGGFGCSSLFLPSAGACSVAGVWCGWSLATPGAGSCVLLPATPGWVSLPVVVGGPRHSWLGSAGGGGVWCVVCGGGVLVGLWLVCGVVGPSPLLAEVPVCYSPPLLAGFRCRWWWAVPATPGWGPLAVVVCGVWCVAVVCWWGCGSCVVWLVPRHSWRRFLCATPRHSWLGFAAGGGGRSPPLLAGVRWRRCCVVCGVWRWCVGGVVAGVWCGWSLATPGGGSCVLLPATPGWVSLPVVVGGPRHSWLGSACGGGVWCVVCGVWCVVVVCGVVGPSPLLAVVPLCFSPPLLAGFCCRWLWAVPATPGWGPLAAVVCGVWCAVCGGGVLLGLWLVCGVWWWSVVGVVVGVWCGWSLATPGGGPCVLLPAAPGWVSLPLVVGGPHHSWLGSVGGSGVWCVVCGVLVGSLATPGGGSCVLLPATPGWVSLAAVVCGVWCVAVVCCLGCGWCVVWLVPRQSWRRSLCATPRHSWLGFAAGGGGRSPPLLAGVRWRRWCVVCGVWCVAVVCCWGCGWCVVWLVPRHSWRRSLCATPRHSWLGFAAAGGGRSPLLLAGVRWRRSSVVCGVWWWCVVGVVVGVWRVAVVCCWGCGWCVVWLVPRHSWRWSLCATPRHSWLGFAAGGGRWSPPLLAGGPLAALVCGVWCVVCWWGPSPLLAEVPVCYSPPLLAGFRWRRWCVVCGVWR